MEKARSARYCIPLRGTYLAALLLASLALQGCLARGRRSMLSPCRFPPQAVDAGVDAGHPKPSPKPDEETRPRKSASARNGSAALQRDYEQGEKRCGDGDYAVLPKRRQRSAPNKQTPDAGRAAGTRGGTNPPGSPRAAAGR